jgi:hypothetical protein
MVLRLRAADSKLVQHFAYIGAQTSNYSFHVNDIRSAVLFYVGRSSPGVEKIFSGKNILKEH